MSYKVQCPHCRFLTWNNKPRCSHCGLLLSKTKGCKCDYCKKPIRKYESVLKSALVSWYTEKCKFPEDEANVISCRVINDLETGKCS